MKAWILGILLVIAGLVLVLGLWLLGYHLSGRWAFNHWKAERIAMGDRFEWEQLAPPPVPAEQNFAEAPLIRGSIIEKGQVDPHFKALEVPKLASDAMGNWQEGRRDDLASICMAYPAKDLHAAFKPLDAALTELDKASRRPASRLPIDCQEGEIPALVGFRAVTRTLRIRALANLRSGHPDQALEDLQTCFHIAEHLKNEPYLISALLRNAILSIGMQVVWEGVEDHLWPASHLAAIQTDLSKADLLTTSRRAWQGERQNAIAMHTAMAENRPLPKQLSEPRDRSVQVGALARGWMYRNLLEYCRFMSNLADAQDPAVHRVFPQSYVESDQWLERLRTRPDLVIARIQIPALGGQVSRFAKLQALIDLGQVVCALERYRLNKGFYPDRLEALLPTYLQVLPHDLVTGGPLHYAREGGSFSLYQVGWDGKDDGGRLVWVGEGEDRKVDPAKGDWTWPHATPLGTDLSQSR